MSEAQARVARIRSESERELAAASARRDSINAQLANVRQMLQTLTGSSGAAPAVDEAGPGRRDGRRRTGRRRA